jgi:hypothetical protein
MKPMLDNDIDQLFKSSLEDFEVSPAANSWDKITDGLDQKPKTKKYPIFWMAAASVMLVATLGITLFNQETDVIRLRGNQTKDLAALEQPVKKQVEDNSVRKNNDLDVDQNTAIVSVNKYSSTKSADAVKEIEKNLQPDATNSSPVNVFNTNEQKEEITLAAVKPVREKTVTERILEIESLNNQTSKINKENSLIAQNITDENLEGDGNLPDRKLKIKSIGDLVNFVVAKVDKREEKIIKMGKTSESDNEITGINLGLIKYSKTEK